MDLDILIKKGLHMFIGPMFSGKTTKLLEIYNLLISYNNKNKILLINHSSDKRYGESQIISHDGKQCPCYSLNTLNEIYSLVEENTMKNVEFVLIDEAQFFTDLYEIVLKLLKNNKNIYLVGLDGDFQQKPFLTSRLLELIPYAITIKKYNAKCYICKEPACLTKRLTNSKDVIFVGGKDDYQPACIKHAYLDS